jgi:hypothetical protein
VIAAQYAMTSSYRDLKAASQEPQSMAIAEHAGA